MARMEMEWDWGMVFLSVCVAVQAIYTTVHILQLRLSIAVVPVAALTLSVCGIWSMHFVGMAAMYIPAHVTYDVGLTITSAIVAYVFCLMGLVIIAKKVPPAAITHEVESSLHANVEALRNAPHGWVMIAGVCAAAGICTMHYVGMAAMSVTDSTSYRYELQWGYIIGSCLIAVVACVGSLYCAFVLPVTRRFPVIASITGGAAASAKHYVGMHGFHTFEDSPLPSAEDGSSSIRAATPYIVLGSCTASLLCMSVSSQVYRKHMYAVQQQIEEALETTGEVILAMKRYDTDLALKIIEQHTAATEQQTNGNSNSNSGHNKKEGKSLLGRLASLTKNLEKYRPFLPNYLFISATSDDDSEDEQGAASDTDTLSSIDSLWSSPALSGAAEAGLSGADSSSGSRPMVDFNPPSAGNVLSKPNSPPPPTGEAQESALARSQNGSSLRRKQTRVLHRTNVLGASIRHMDTMAHATSTVARVWLDFTRFAYRVARGGSMGPPGVPRMNSISISGSESMADSTTSSDATTFVSQIFLKAGSLKGAVHGFVGDLLEVSWNATQRAAQPELKAALFLARIRKEMKIRSLDGEVTGVACAGEAVVSSIVAQAGPTSGRQNALLIHCPGWQGRMEGAFQLARRHRAILMDETTQKTATYSVSCCAVDVIHYRPMDDAGSSAPLFDHLALGAPPAVETEHGCFQTPQMMDGSQIESVYAAPHAQVLYRILEEVDHVDDEWMYQLQLKDEMENGLTTDERQAKRICAALDDVMAALKAGDRANAKRIAAEVDADTEHSTARCSLVNRAFASLKLLKA